jgi:pilus assembly protein CpaE
MGVVTVLSAKGGCGASLVATNLALALAHTSPTLLVDLHAHEGTDDLLLDLHGDHAWPELLPVAAELTDRHIELVASRHAEGLILLAAPSSTPNDLMRDGRTRGLLDVLSTRFTWVVVDAPSGAWTPAYGEASDMFLLVTTADPPALRCARRLLQSRPPATQGRLGLVLNQFGRSQPASAAEVAASLECPLLAAIPVDPRGVGYQVNFGRACVLDRQSPVGRAIAQLARRMTVAGTRKPETASAAAPGSSR